jgi:cell wall-associated NlpC family hydrolase
MRRALDAHRTTLSGSRTRSFFIALLGILALLYPAASEATPRKTNTVDAKTPVSHAASALAPKASKHSGKAKRRARAAKPKQKQPAAKVAAAKKPSKLARKTKGAAPARSVAKPADTKVAARHTPTNHARKAKRRSHQRVATHHPDPAKLTIPEGDGSPVLSAAASYLGRPYRFGSQGRAFDCSGFVRTVFADMGVEVPHSARELATLGDRIDREELEPGDLVFFRITPRHYATHVGIYVGDDKFVHAATRGGQVQVDSLSDTYYARHYCGARRIEI